MVRLRLRDSIVGAIDLIPYKSLAQTGCLTLLKDTELSQFEVYLSFLSTILSDEREIKKYWYAWCALMGPKWLGLLSLHSPRAFVRGLLPCKNSGVKSLLLTRNLITCEAHHELLSTYLDLVRKDQVNAAKDYIPAIRTLQRGKVPE